MSVFDDIGEVISGIVEETENLIENVKEIGEEFTDDMSEIAEDELGIEDAKEKLTFLRKIFDIVSKIPPFPHKPGDI